MKTKFQFDKKTGTIVPTNVEVQKALKANVEEDITHTKPSVDTQKPVFMEEKKIETKPNHNLNVQQNLVVQMKRVDKPTAIQLIDDKGFPESYLDSETTGVVMFRERQDYDILQVTEERTQKVLCYIGGYALQFNFNMKELNTLEKIEQCLQGLMKLFRHKILTQNLNQNNINDTK